MTRARPALLAPLEDRGVLTVGDAAGHVAGEPIRGSWWGHPKSHAIFDALQEIEDHPDVLLCKLVEGKQTFVHRRLWPALVRVQREEALWPKLSAEAARLLARVEREGKLTASGKVRVELERAMRVVGIQEHTPSGAHQVVLVPFKTWVPAKVRAQADRLTVEDALEALRAAGFKPAPAASAGKSKGRPAARGRKAKP
jgi:hypothetical protein